MKRWVRRLFALALCLFAAAAPLLSAGAAGESVPLGTKGLGQGPGSAPSSGGYKESYLVFDPDKEVTQADFGPDKAAGLSLTLAGVRSDFITGTIRTKLEGSGVPAYIGDGWPFSNDRDDPYKDWSHVPSMTESVELEGLGTTVFAPFSHGKTTYVAEENGSGYYDTQYSPEDCRLDLTRAEGAEDFHYEGHHNRDRLAEQSDGDGTVLYAISSSCVADITNISYQGNTVYADIEGEQWARCTIKERGGEHPVAILDEQTADVRRISEKQVACSFFRDEASGYPILTLTANEVTFYFYVNAVLPGTGVPEIIQEVTEHAQETPGEDGGTTINPVIVDGTDGRTGNGGFPTRAVIVGVVGALAGIAGAVALSSSGGAEEKKPSTYKMYISKHFGDMIKKGAPPCWVYARIAEVKPGGEEVNRPDLTAKIEPYCENEVLDVRDGGMTEGYKAAQVFAPEETVDSEGTVSFRFRGPGGTFVRHVVFSLEEVKIVFGQENMGLPAHYEKAVPLYFGVIGAPKDTTVKAVMADEDAPYSVDLKQDPKEPRVFCAVIRDKRMDDEKEPGYTRAWRLRVRAEWNGVGADGTTGKRYKESDFLIYRIFMGLVLQLEADAIGCYLQYREGAEAQASARAGGSDLGKNLYNASTAVNPMESMLAAGLQATVGAATGGNTREEDVEACVTKGTLLLLNWNDAKQEIERVAVYADKAVAVTALRVENNTNAIAGPAGESDQEMVRKLGICAFPQNVLDASTGARQTLFCSTLARLDRPIRIRAEITVTAQYEGKAYAAKKKVLLHSMPFRKPENADEYQRQLAEDNRIRIFLEKVRDEIWDHYMYCLSSLHFLAERLIDGYDKAFGYDPEQVWRVADYWVRFCRGQVVGKNGTQYKPDIRDDLAACVAFAEGMRDNGGLIGRIALGVCTSGYSELLFFGMELHDKMKEAVFACKDDSFGCWEGIKLGAKEYARQEVYGMVVGGALKLGGKMGSAFLSDALKRDTTITAEWGRLMGRADQALRNSSKAYRGAAQALEAVEAFGAGGARAYKKALENAKAEEDAIRRRLEAEAEAAAQKDTSIAQRRMGQGDKVLSTEQLSERAIEDAAMERAMEDLRDFDKAQSELAAARRQGPEALAAAQEAYDQAYLKVSQNKNAFKRLKAVTGSKGLTLKASYARTRNLRKQKIYDRILDDACQELGLRRSEVYIEETSGHGDAWKEEAGLELGEDVDMRIVQVNYSARGDNVLVGAADARYSSLGNDVTIPKEVGQRIMARNVYKEYHGGAEPPDIETALKYTARKQDWSYVEGPILGTEGKMELDFDLEAFADLNTMIGGKNTAGTGLQAKRLDQLTLKHKSMEWYRRAETARSEADALKAKLETVHGEERLAMKKDIDALMDEYVADKGEAMRQLGKGGTNMIGPRAEYRQGMGMSTKWSAAQKEMVERARRVTVDGRPSDYEDYLKRELGFSYEEAVDEVVSCLE